MLKTYIIQHVPFESPGILEELPNYELIRMYDTFSFPKVDEVGLLIVMGGPMNVHDSIEWLEKEKDFIKQIIARNKPILGICLGAQLIAEAIGGEVIQNPNGKEVGWWPIQKVSKDVAFDFLPDTLEVLHWHGDTFTLPNEATTFYSSAICRNQAFLYKHNVVGLQFHFETTKASLKALVDADEDYLDGGEYVQTKHEILQHNPSQKNADILLKLVDHLKSSVIEA